MPFSALEKFFIFLQNKPTNIQGDYMLKKGSKFIFVCAFAVIASYSFAESTGTIESKSRINWITREFISDISLDTKKADIQMPGGKKLASSQIITKMPQLIQPPLLSLFTDCTNNLSDMVIDERLTLDEVRSFIMGGYKTADSFSHDIKTLNTTNTTNINDIGSLLIKHSYPYTPEEPIDTVSTRPFSGIIIDARGKLPVHGEYVKDNVYACFFPQIWDDKMDIIYEKNAVTPDIIKNSGLVAYNYTDNISDYEDRVGIDPLYIRAVEVYGRNRTDPVIKHGDALKILAQPENVELLKSGKVVVLIDKPQLIYDIAVPEKSESYYVHFEEVKRYFYENKVPAVTVSDSINGIVFSVNLKFIPDSAELLPSEYPRITAIANNLKNILEDNGYTILVEGHTADVGKPVGQLNLSIERTKTVMDALIGQGLDKSIFTYKGYGGTMPKAPNNTEEGRAQNRRVDITARPRATYIQRDW